MLLRCQSSTSLTMPHTTFFKHEMETRHEYKDRRQADKLAAERSCYEKVDDRDESVCRVTGVFLTPGATDPKKRRVHHHMVPRSRGGEHQTVNVITISDYMHTLIHAGKAHLSGDADLRDPDGRFCGVQYDVMTDAGWKTERML